jgi:GTP-binding protein Era
MPITVDYSLDSFVRAAHNEPVEELDLPPGHRSGFVAVAGRPNVGKSTLINAYLGQPLAPVSPRPQTTREPLTAILTLPHAQVVFLDTPGIHRPLHKLGRWMNDAAEQALTQVDLALAVFDLTAPPGEEDARVAERVRTLVPPRPMLAAFNKLDAVRPEEVESRSEAYRALLPEAEALAVSATRGDNRPQLLEQILERLPEGPRWYPTDQITEAYERDLAADLIRAAALGLLRQEVPHALAVRVDEYKERDERGVFLAATLFVERESQKGIVIGKGGTMLRRIGMRAREDIERLTSRRAYLQLRVKVQPGWRNDEKALKRLGYQTPRPSRPGRGAHG